MEDIYDVRKSLAEIVGSLDEGDDDDDKNDRYLQLSECDVTGSLGIWGIKQV